MKLDSRSVIEIVGLTAVVASLLFVGMQLALDRKIAIANQYQSRAELRIQRLLGQIESDNFLQLRADMWEDDKPNWWNTEVEEYWAQQNQPMSSLVTLVTDWEIFIVSIDNNYYQYRQGLLEEEIWANSRQVLENALDNPIRRALYETISGVYLREVIDEITNEPVSN